MYFSSYFCFTIRFYYRVISSHEVYYEISFGLLDYSLNFGSFHTTFSIILYIWNAFILSRFAVINVHVSPTSAGCKMKKLLKQRRLVRCMMRIVRLPVLKLTGVLKLIFRLTMILTIYIIKSVLS